MFHPKMPNLEGGHAELGRFPGAAGLILYDVPGLNACRI